MIIRACQLCGSGHYWVDEVRLIIVGHLLQYLRRPSDTSALAAYQQQSHPALLNVSFSHPTRDNITVIDREWTTCFHNLHMGSLRVQHAQGPCQCQCSCFLGVSVRRLGLCWTP